MAISQLLATQLCEQNTLFSMAGNFIDFGYNEDMCTPLIQMAKVNAWGRIANAVIGNWF